MLKSHLLVQHTFLAFQTVQIHCERWQTVWHGTVALKVLGPTQLRQLPAALVSSLVCTAAAMSVKRE